MGVNDAGKVFSAPLTFRCLRQQVLVLADEHAAKFGGPVQQVGVFQLRGAVNLRGQHIHASQDQATRDRRRHVHVQVEADATAVTTLAHLTNRQPIRLWSVSFFSDVRLHNKGKHERSFFSLSECHERKAC